MDWRQAEILELISMYRENECLWNPLHEEYKDLNLKKNAWQDLADHFNKDINEVKKKIKNLRTGYVVEKKKVDAKKGYEPRLFYYDELTFLDPVVILRSNILDAQMNGNVSLTEKRRQTAMNGGSSPAPKKVRRIEYDDDEVDLEIRESTPPRTHIEFSNDTETEDDTQQSDYQMVNQDEHSKEETFCEMLRCELKLIKSEDVYDNVTSEIFTIVKNAKMAERQIVYQPEEHSRNMRR